MAINRSENNKPSGSLRLQADRSVLEWPERSPSGEWSRGNAAERPLTISFFGGFGLGNFGNESTLQAILYHVRRLQPDAQVNCICTDPGATAAIHDIPTVPISSTVVRAGTHRNRLLRALRAACIGIPSEIYRWFEALRTLKGSDVLIIPGTGLLTDAYGLSSWGPYGLFKWSLIARIRGCGLLFVSVGAGPIHSYAAKWMVRSALALATFRSYRDVETKEYLTSIAAARTGDRVYPDLAFSLPDQSTLHRVPPPGRRSVVGLGLMLYHSSLSADVQRDSTYASYLEQLVVFVRWLLTRDYDVRLLIGELSDNPVVIEFKALLSARLGDYDEARIIGEPILSVEDLMAQLAETDVVVATRFHNVVLALTLNKPVISISFHQKCTSLMESMGMREYCQDIKQLNAEMLIEQFCQLETNDEGVRRMIRERVAKCRKSLDEQYEQIFNEIGPK